MSTEYICITDAGRKRYSMYKNYTFRQYLLRRLCDRPTGFLSIDEWLGPSLPPPSYILKESHGLLNRGLVRQLTPNEIVIARLQGKL